MGFILFFSKIASGAAEFAVQPFGTLKAGRASAVNWLDPGGNEKFREIIAQRYRTRNKRAQPIAAAAPSVTIQVLLPGCG